MFKVSVLQVTPINEEESQFAAKDRMNQILGAWVFGKHQTHIGCKENRFIF
jgi:hypothetical protein